MGSILHGARNFNVVSEVTLPLSYDKDIDHASTSSERRRSGKGSAERNIESLNGKRLQIVRGHSRRTEGEAGVGGEDKHTGQGCGQKPLDYEREIIEVCQMSRADE